MKKPNSLLKLAAVVSSVLLAGGFVSYRAGAFDHFLESSAPPADSESSPTRAGGNEATESTIMHGSKSPVYRYVVKPNTQSAQPPSPSQPSEQPK